MSDFHFIDNTLLSDLSHDAVNYNPTALNALYAPGRTIVITSTVYHEATLNPNNPYSAARQTWLDEGLASGRIEWVDTPGYPAGVIDAGELSMIHAANTQYSGQPVTFVSNDNFFDNFNALNTQPGQVHYTAQTHLFETLMEGGISPAEYFITSTNLAIQSGEAPQFAWGQEIVGSNGVIIDARNSAAIRVIAADGTETTMYPFTRFTIDADGNVNQIGVFVPGTGQVIDINDQCFLAGTMITMADGSKKPIEQIRPDDWVLSMDQKTGQMVPGKVTRTFQNEAKIILDFHGTSVTPGHVYYRPDSKRSAPAVVSASVWASRFCSVVETRAYPMIMTYDDKNLPNHQASYHRFLERLSH